EQVRRSEVARAFPESRIDLTPPADVVPYYVLSVRQGIPGVLETWDYRLGCGLGADPLRYRGKNYVDRGLLLNPCLAQHCPPIVQDAEISFLGGTTFAGPEMNTPETWSWNPDAHPVQGGAAEPTYDASRVLNLVQAAEAITPPLEANPAFV